MSIYNRFSREVLDDSGRLKEFTLDYPDSFNFGYDVVDAIAEETPDKRALVWCNTENEEHTFTFEDVRRRSKPHCQRADRVGIRRGMRVMLVLKRHYEYWFCHRCTPQAGRRCDTGDPYLTTKTTSTA
jgi:acetyl-CoA synthetase